MCPTPSAASASARGGNEGGSGAEAGGGDAYLEMRKVKRGCIIDDEGAQDESGSQVLRVSSVIIILSFTKHKEGGKKDTYEL